MNAPCNSSEIVEVTLVPGQFYFGERYTRIHTLLGSCVAITMWHPVKHIGGMCHYLLPSRGACQRLTHGYYADDAVNMFMREVGKANTKPAEYEVKVFGGGNMFETINNRTSPINVPQNNITSGCQLLKQHGFKVKATDLGGRSYRKIYLELWNGDVWVQRGGSRKRESGT